MKKILVPMDFTSVGANAVRYALKACKGSQIDILYVRNGVVDTNEPLILRQSLLQEEYWKNALRDFLLKELQIDRLPENTTISILAGALVHEIINMSKEGSYEAIIMGTRDKYNYFDKLFGTTSLGIIKNATIPVYVIPKYASFSGYKRVMIASDKELTNPELVEKIRIWNSEHKAYVKFLHIENQKNGEFDEEKKAIVSELFIKNDLEFAFEIEVLKDDDVSHSLLASAYDMKADLLLVIAKDQNYLQTLLFKSISKELILQSDIPLLFINSKT